MTLKRDLNLLFVPLWLVLDVLAVALALFCSHYIRFKLGWPPPEEIHAFEIYYRLWFLLTVVYVGMMVINGLYRPQRHVPSEEYFLKIIAAIALGTIISLGISTLFWREVFEYSRLLIGYTAILSVIFLTFERVALSLSRGMLYQRNMGAVRTVIVGHGSGSEFVHAHLQRLPQLGYEVVGILDDDPDENSLRLSYPLLGRVDFLPNVISEYAVKEVIITLPELNTKDLMRIIDLCPTENVHIRVHPDLFQFLVTTVQVDEISGLPLLTVKEPRLAIWHRVAKRSMDVLVAALTLVVLSGPLLLVALLIRIDSAGPTFFVQERVGRDGKAFPIIKFRTMADNSSGKDNRDWTVPNDPRRTRLGKFLRRFSIDELPNLINVLMGHMSLVGPRAEQPQYVRRFSAEIPRYMERHREKAGMTGWAQVNGLRGDVPIDQRTQYDLYYIENWSIFFDVRILLRTIIAVFKQPAY
jgi:exopolysaccharide biosynthesis polyprenyl glycosylphosphotransferase